MCDAAAVGLGVASSAMGAYSSYKQQKAQNDANEYNAQVAEQNAINLETSAKQVEAQGEAGLVPIEQGIEATKARQRVAFAAGGVTVGKGSGEQLALETAKQGAIDVMTAKFNTAAEARNIRTQAASQTMQAGLLREGKSSPGTAAAIGLIGGATNLASTFAINKLIK